MQITGPKSLKLKQLSCTLFKTRTKQSGERLYLSIKEKGIKEPLLVTPINGNPTYPKAKYEIVDGFQRFSVAKDLNFKEIPALIVEDATEKEVATPSSWAVSVIGAIAYPPVASAMPE